MALVKISKSTFEKAARNRRCVLIGGDEGASTFQCGKRILVQVHDQSAGGGFYRITGKSAMYTGYSLRSRNKGYHRDMITYMRGDVPTSALRTTKRKKRRR